MRFSKSATIIAALAMASTGALALSQRDVKAATIATVHSSNIALLYTSNGEQVKNRALAPNTPWLVGKTISINGEKLYQVATNEYLKASDSQLSNSQSQNSNKIVGKLNGFVSSFVYNDQLGDITGKIITPDSSWTIGKHIVNKYGQHYVQISSHEFVPTTNMSFSSQLPEPTYYPNFDVLGKSPYSNDEVPSNNNNNQTNTDNPVNDYKPNLAKINDYFVKYLNALHAANGTAPVQSTSDMINYAQQRAGQQAGQNLDHSTATRSTSENLSSAGFSYMKYAGVASDKDAAYFLLKDWYDETGNGAALGSGFYGHRAALIYSGPNVGLGITDGDASFDADWNYSTLDEQNALYSSTSSNPDTKFISEDSVQ